MTRSEEPQTGAANPKDGPGKTNLFVYGSLMYEEVWRRLVTRECKRIPAWLYGYRRLRIRGEDYPGLVKGDDKVRGVVCLGLDDETLRRIDRFEADCYQRGSGEVVNEAGEKIPADFFEIKQSHMFVIEQKEWDAEEFERSGLARFLADYEGFKV